MSSTDFYHADSPSVLFETSNMLQYLYAKVFIASHVLLDMKNFQCMQSPLEARSSYT